MVFIKNNLFLFLLAAIFISLYACKNDNLEDIHPEIFNPPATPCDTAGMTYDADMKPLFLSKCGSDRTACHKAPNTQDVNLDNFTDARDLAVNGDIMGSVLHQGGYQPMPDGGGMLDQCSINKIQNWIDRGCPEN
jgi:hypothetical protein